MININRLEQLKQYLEQSPGDSFLNYCIALEYVKQEDPQTAMQYFRFIVNNDPDYIGTYYQLGKLYEKLEDNSSAIATYDQGMVIANKLQDQHAYSELQSAKSLLVNDFEVEFDD